MIASGPEQGTKHPQQPIEVIGCLDVAMQALLLLEQLDDSQYRHVAEPYLQSSIGCHMRHILDVFHALGSWPVKALVNYDVRRRAHPVEVERSVAKDEWHRVSAWLETLSPSHMSSPIQVKSEVRLSNQAHAVMTSTLGRELAFVSSHAVHHMALIRVSLTAQGIMIDDDFGLAPATLSHKRGE